MSTQHVGKRWTHAVYFQTGETEETAITYTNLDLEAILGYGSFQIMEGSPDQVTMIHTSLRCAQLLSELPNTHYEALTPTQQMEGPDAWTHLVYVFTGSCRTFAEIRRQLGTEAEFAVRFWIHSPLSSIISIETMEGPAKRLERCGAKVHRIDRNGKRLD